MDDFLKQCKDSAFKTKLFAWNTKKQKAVARRVLMSQLVLSLIIPVAFVTARCCRWTLNVMISCWEKVITAL